MFALAGRVTAAIALHGGWADRAAAGGCGVCDDDRDGLTNAQEAGYGTLLDVDDTDGDRWSDGAEILIYGSDPLDPGSVPFTLTGRATGTATA